MLFSFLNDLGFIKVITLIHGQVRESAQKACQLYQSISHKQLSA